MKLDSLTGLMSEVSYIDSPNQDDRPENCPVNLLVIHGISLPPGRFGGPWIDDLFTNCLDLDQDPYFREIEGIRVSSHFLIRRDGRVIQYVPVHRRAWHAGKSCFEDREACNDFSIGIELEGSDDMPYEDVQYERLGDLVHALMRAYPDLGLDRIVGHSDIAPGRKTDPGPFFDWVYFRNILSQKLASSNTVDNT